jgi:hypothetical protein
MQTGSSGTLIGWKSVKPLLSLYGSEWRERGYELCKNLVKYHFHKSTDDFCRIVIAAKSRPMCVGSVGETAESAD